jgi:hypothetical protein
MLRKVAGLALLQLFFPVGLLTAAVCMEFRTGYDPEEHITFIIGEGPIIDGDASRLETIIPQADRDRFGNIPMYLNSPGGSVAAALAIVQLMDRHEFTVIVSSNAICASACASVVYVSARFHQVIGTGRLGIHSCYTQSDPAAAPEPSSFCNHVIAKNAYEHGTSYSSVNMWQKAYGPDSVAWIEQDVACKYGLCGPPGFDDTPAVPSFNCQLVKKVSEIAICSNKRLARHEASLANCILRRCRNWKYRLREHFEPSNEHG